MRSSVSALVLCSSLAMLGCEGAGDGGDGGDDGAPMGNPAILEFTASADAVPRGETVELTWKVENARTVTIFSATEILVTTSEPEGVVTTLPVRDRSTFTLRASGSGPAVSRTVDIDAIWPEPTIHSFTVDQERTIEQTFITLRWETENAQMVTILANDVPVPNGTFNGLAARASTLTTIVQTATTTFTLKAVNPTHTVEDEVVVYAIPPPMFRDYRVTPRTFIGTSTIATITWDSVGFDRVELLANFSRVPTFPGGLRGSFQMTIHQPTELSLIGWVGDLQYGQTYSVIAYPAQEYEPNDDPAFAQYIGYEGGARGSIATSSDVDHYYIIDVFEPSDLRIWVRGEQGGCPTDVQIELFRAFREQGGEPIGADQDDGIPTGRGGACPEISPERDEFARAVIGSFIVAVRGERGETGPYLLLTEATPARPR